MTDEQFQVKLLMYELWLQTNPSMSAIIKENDKLSTKLKRKKYGRRINSKH